MRFGGSLKQQDMYNIQGFLFLEVISIDLMQNGCHSILLFGQVSENADGDIWICMEYYATIGSFSVFG